MNGEMMTERIGFVVDSTADFPDGLAQNLGLQIVPVHIFVDGRDFLHGVTISNRVVIENLHRQRSVKTAPPFPGEYSELYEKLAQRYEHIVSFHMSSELSDCYRSALNAIRIVPEELACRITPIDTRNAGIGQGLIIKKSVELIRSRRSVERLDSLLSAFIQNAFMFFSVDNLFWLKRSGKTSALASLLGGLLDIKPVIGLENGRLVSVGRHRGQRAALQAMVVQAAEAYDIYRRKGDLWVAHADAHGAALVFRDQLSRQLHRPADLIPIAEMGPTLTAHTGPGCVCLAMIPHA
jgi:DegV family protein with EDD domain